MDYGMKDQDPIENVRFYCKDDLNKAFGICKDQVWNEDLSWSVLRHKSF